MNPSRYRQQADFCPLGYLGAVARRFDSLHQICLATISQFQNYVCGQIPALLFTCANIYADVESYSSFSNVVINSQIDGSGNFINNMQYNPGDPSDIVVVRLFYQWPLYVTGLATTFRICRAISGCLSPPLHSATSLTRAAMKSIWQIWLRARLTAASLIEDCRGIAATEFALIVPIMLVMFFGTGGGPQGYADGANARRSDVAVAIGRRQRWRRSELRCTT